MHISSFSGQYRFLSNFYPSVIQYMGLTFPTVEHAFQASKTLDRQDQLDISRAKTPGDAKRMGRVVTLRRNWDVLRLLVMEELLALKFENPELRQRLLETENALLTEGNTWGDHFWGICGNHGHNHLGELLMKIRGEIQ